MGPPTLISTPTVLTSWFCPFAQRTLIAANAKKASADIQFHEVTFDELYGKPQWFLNLNPAGMVPTIAWKADGNIPNQTVAGAGQGVISIKESLVCNEYLEDAYPSPPLLPKDAVGRAAARSIIHRFSDKFVPAFYKYLVLQDKPSQQKAADTLDKELTWLVQHISSEGPLALSGELSLVDCAIAPFLLRLFILQHYRSYSYQQRLSSYGAADRLQRYINAAEHHPAVAGTMYHPKELDYKQQLIQSYQRYADGSANSQMARDAQAN
eukprot:GHRR01004978.1.p1 GENE.GHRR01004978.1~~GHRR01004978.1.p1  ORF type:complete len:267 (+),score=79.87 GHRR01004978.1:77-877(+)